MNPAPAKVLRLITRLNIGGPAIQAVTLSAELPPEEFATTLACGRTDPGEGDMAYLAAERGLRPFVIPSLHRELSAADDLRSVREIARLLRRERPAILHTHLSKAGALGRIAAHALRGVRTVHTFHGNVLRGYFPPSRARAYLLMERLLARGTDRLVALSESQKKEMLERYRIGRESQYAVVPLGFDLARFARCGASRGGLRRELGIPGEAPVVAIVGRLVPIKDHDLFLRAARLVSEAVPETFFLIVGDGLLRGELEGKSRAAGIGDRVRFTGWRRDLERVYADADVVALTSVNEGTPVSLIEASAAGRPVVATDVGGVGDVVRGEESGLLAKRRDPREFSRLIALLLRDPARARAMGEAGRERVLRRYAKERLLGDIARLYRGLLG